MNQAGEPKGKDPEKNTKPQKPALYRDMENQMEEYFGTTTTINQRGKRGKIEIEFMSESDLIRILDLLNIQL